MVRKLLKLFPSIKMIKIWWGMTLRGPDLVWRQNYHFLSDLKSWKLTRKIENESVFDHSEVKKSLSECLESAWKLGKCIGKCLGGIWPCFHALWSQKTDENWRFWAKNGRFLVFLRLEKGPKDLKMIQKWPKFNPSQSQGTFYSYRTTIWLTFQT